MFLVIFELIIAVALTTNQTITGLDCVGNIILTNRYEGKKERFKLVTGNRAIGCYVCKR